MAQYDRDNELRESVRGSLTFWLDKLRCDGNVETTMDYKRRFVEKLRHSPVAVHTDKANEQHYEVPTAFFKTVLGKRLKYSCCYWPDDVGSLDRGGLQSLLLLNVAEDAMLDLTCQRAQIQNGQTILDLGCGWGSTAFWIVEHYPKCRVTCVSNSRSQAQYITEEAQRQGVPSQVQAITNDVNMFEATEKFDRIISIEMFEHIKNYKVLMKRISSWLKPRGMLFVQILCHREFAYEFKAKEGSSSEWMSEHFFTGGTMPSDDLLLYFQDDMKILDHWRLNGMHYQKTLDAWLEILDSEQETVSKIFQKTYGRATSESRLFDWRMFFLYASEAFGFSGGNEWIVAQYLFSGQLRSSL